MHILFVLCLLLNDSNYFWNKYCNLPFVAIYHNRHHLLIFLFHPDIKKQKLVCEWACETKKMIIILKDFIKQPGIKQSPTFLRFSFLIDCCISVFFSFLIKALANFEELIRFHWQAFIVYKNGKKLKMLTEIFCLLDHLKPKIFFVGQPWWST